MSENLIYYSREEGRFSLRHVIAAEESEFGPDHMPVWFSPQ